MGLSFVRAGASVNTWRAVKVFASGNQPIAHNTLTQLSFSSTLYDTNGFWNSEIPHQITIPAGITMVRFTAQMIYGAENQTDFRSFQLLKDSAQDLGLFLMRVDATITVSTPVRLNSHTGPVSVSEGDTFQLAATHFAGVTVSALASASHCWLACESV